MLIAHSVPFWTNRPTASSANCRAAASADVELQVQVLLETKHSSRRVVTMTKNRRMQLAMPRGVGLVLVSIDSGQVSHDQSFINAQVACPGASDTHSIVLRPSAANPNSPVAASHLSGLELTRAVTLQVAGYCMNVQS